MSKIDLNTIRYQNLRNILDALQRNGTLTRQKIALETGLSLMSVTNLVDQLLRNHVIELLPPSAQEAAKRQTGRKAELVSLDVRNDLWMVISLTDKYFRFATMRADRKITYNSQSWVYLREQTYENNLRKFLTICAQFIAAHASHILGIAVIVPGPYDPATDCVSNMRIPELNSICLKRLLGEMFGEVYMYVDEDVKFAARAYAEFYQDAQSLYYLYIGEGVGGALAQDGRIFRGLNAVAGDPSQLAAGDGETFEQRISLDAFLRRFQIDDDASLGVPQSLDRLTKLARTNAAEYKQSLNEIAEDVSKLLYLVAWMLDPYAVVVDCVYARPMECDFVNIIKGKLKSRLSLDKNPEFCKRLPGMEATYFGAVKALEKYWIESMK